MRRRSFLDLGLKCLAATGSAQLWAQKALASRATKYSSPEFVSKIGRSHRALASFSTTALLLTNR
jgi:hypothetical protein